MANTLDQFPPPHWGGKPAIYPWDDWLDGRVHELEHGTDFTTSRQTFRHTASMAARRRGHGLKTAILRDTNTVVIQAVNIHGPEQPANPDTDRGND